MSPVFATERSRPLEREMEARKRAPHYCRSAEDHGLFLLPAGTVGPCSIIPELFHALVISLLGGVERHPLVNPRQST